VTLGYTPFLGSLLFLARKAAAVGLFADGFAAPPARVPNTGHSSAGFLAASRLRVSALNSFSRSARAMVFFFSWLSRSNSPTPRRVYLRPASVQQKSIFSPPSPASSRRGSSRHRAQNRRKPQACFCEYVYRTTRRDPPSIPCFPYIGNHYAHPRYHPEMHALHLCSRGAREPAAKARGWGALGRSKASRREEDGRGPWLARPLERRIRRVEKGYDLAAPLRGFGLLSLRGSQDRNRSVGRFPCRDCVPGRPWRNPSGQRRVAVERHGELGSKPARIVPRPLTGSSWPEIFSVPVFSRSSRLPQAWFFSHPP